jgi:hypothetical protein
MIHSNVVPGYVQHEIDDRCAPRRAGEGLHTPGRVSTLNSSLQRCSNAASASTRPAGSMLIRRLLGKQVSKFVQRDGPFLV